MRAEVNEKVLAMYRAVWALIDEGWDIHKMKVADITNRAGIGKGTAYEYFRSKEEILRKAMAYDFFLQYEALEESVRGQDNFKDAVEGCFTWLMENRDRRRFAMQFIKREGAVPGQKLRDFTEAEEEVFCGLERLRRLLAYLTELGKKDGVIRRDIPEYFASVQIFSQIFGFFVYQEHEQEISKKDLDQMKEFLLKNLFACMSADSVRCSGE